MENSTSYIKGLDKPKIARKMLIQELLFYIPIIVIAIAAPGVLLWIFLSNVIEMEEYFYLVPFGLMILVSLSLAGIVIYLQVCSLSARKEIFSYVSGDNHTSLINCLDLHNFQGQHKMRQKDLFRMKHAVAAVGDLQLLNSLSFLVDILLCDKPLSWNVRKWTAHAIAKIGTAPAIKALDKASVMYKRPDSSMFPRRVNYKIGSIIIAYIPALRALGAVRRSLKNLYRLNGFTDKNQMIEFLNRI